MEYLNISCADIDSEAFLDAEPVDRATWLMLHRYCCGQENGGIIPGASDWSDRKWQQVARVTLKEVKRECQLWHFDGPNLVVSFYPHNVVAAVQSKRTGGKLGALRRWGNGSAATKPDALPNGIPIGSVNAEVSKVSKVSKECGADTQAETLCEVGVEVPTMDSVLEFAAAWPGDLSRAIPAGIPEKWARNWFGYRSTAATPFPADWRFAMVRKFQAEWVARSPHVLNKGGADGAVSASVQAVQNGNRRREVLEELRELAEEIESYGLADVPDEKKARERELQRELATLN